MAINSRMFPVLDKAGAASTQQSIQPPAPTQVGPYYFFEAQVKVDRNTWDAFQSETSGGTAKEIVRLLEDVGRFQLRHSGTLVEDEYYYFYNFWELGPDSNALARAELNLADKVLWARFTKQVDREEDKQIIFPLTTAARTDLPEDLTGYRYLRVEYLMQHSAFAEVQARLEAELVNVATERGWYFGFTYLHLTGPEGQLVQMWLVPNLLTQAEANEDIAKFSWLRLQPDGTSLFKSAPNGLLLNRSDFDHDPHQASNMLQTALVKLEKLQAPADAAAE